MIQFENVTKRFPGGQEALSGLTLSIDKGEMVFVTGHSGAGKSTLLKLIALIERPTSGQVIVDGQNTRRVRRRRIPGYRRQIGMVFQDHKLLYDRPVSDNVALPLIIAGLSPRDAGKRVRAALDQVGLLHKEMKNPETLSAGEQQRVGIARATVTRPKLLIADEPTGNLDPDLSLEVMRIFRRFNEVGVTLLIASHDIHLIDQLAILDHPDARQALHPEMLGQGLILSHIHGKLHLLFIAVNTHLLHHGGLHFVHDVSPVGTGGTIRQAFDPLAGRVGGGVIDVDDVVDAPMPAGPAAVNLRRNRTGGRFEHALSK